MIIVWGLEKIYIPNHGYKTYLEEYKMKGRNPFSRESFAGDDLSGVEHILDMMFSEKSRSGNSENSAPNDFVEEMKKHRSKAMLMDIGLTPEVGELLNPEITVDYIEAFDAKVVELAKLQLQDDAVMERLAKLCVAVSEQSKLVAEQFKEQEERHAQSRSKWEEQLNALYESVDEERNVKYIFFDGMNDIDHRVGNFIKDLLGTKGVVKKGDVIEFLESLRDRAQDARDNNSYRSMVKEDPEAEYPKPRATRRQEEAEAAAEAVANKPTRPKKSKAKAKTAAAG